MSYYGFGLGDQVARAGGGGIGCAEERAAAAEKKTRASSSSRADDAAPSTKSERPRRAIVVAVFFRREIESKSVLFLHRFLRESQDSSLAKTKEQREERKGEVLHAGTGEERSETSEINRGDGDFMHALKKKASRVLFYPRPSQPSRRHSPKVAHHNLVFAFRHVKIHLNDREIIPHASKK